MVVKPPLGIICLDTTFDKLPGHIRNPDTFDFPILLKVVRGSTPKQLIADASPALLQPFISAAQELEKEGAIAVTGSCGFLVLFQQEISASLQVPFFSSSLLQLPMVHRMIPPNRKIGVIVANKSAFGPRHLKAIGAQKVPIEVAGMENEPEFLHAILEGKHDRLNVDKLRNEVLRQTQHLIEVDPQIAAIVLECTDLPPFSAAIQRMSNRPVFDIVTLSKMMHHALFQPTYIGQNH